MVRSTLTQILLQSAPLNQPRSTRTWLSRLRYMMVNPFIRRNGDTLLRVTTNDKFRVLLTQYGQRPIIPHLSHTSRIARKSVLYGSGRTLPTMKSLKTTRSGLATNEGLSLNVLPAATWHRPRSPVIRNHRQVRETPCVHQAFSAQCLDNQEKAKDRDATTSFRSRSTLLPP